MTLLKRGDLKNDPCPQSWKMIKIRTKNPAARIDNAKVSQYEILML